MLPIWLSDDGLGWFGCTGQDSSVFRHSEEICTTNRMRCITRQSDALDDKTGAPAHGAGLSYYQYRTFSDLQIVDIMLGLISTPRRLIGRLVTTQHVSGGGDIRCTVYKVYIQWYCTTVVLCFKAVLRWRVCKQNPESRPH